MKKKTVKEITLTDKRDAFLKTFIFCKNYDGTLAEFEVFKGRVIKINIDDFLYFLQRQITDEIWRIENIMIPRCKNMNLPDQVERFEALVKTLENTQINKVSDFDIKDFFKPLSAKIAMKTTFLDEFLEGFVL